MRRKRAHRFEGFPHEAHGDRTNGRAAEARFDFIEHRHTSLYVDGDALKGVSDAERVRTRADAGKRDTRKIGRLRRKFDDERFFRYGAHFAHRSFRIRTRHAPCSSSGSNVRTGNIQFDNRDGTFIEQLCAFDVRFERRTGEVCDRHRFQLEHFRQFEIDKMSDTGILQPDRIHKTRRRFP